ncbi:MAG: RnfABCDGE type electron transport complex subunit G [Planctomycetes bacterium]|nr:RnfABCDGE type electron transport complex subunit G [Planctomycetota bacterium]
MKKTLQMVFALGSISLASGASLAGIFVLTDPVIQKQELAAKTQMAKQVLPGAEFDLDSSKKGGPADRFEGRDRDGKIEGVVYVTTARGYGGPIDVVVGMKTDGTIQGVRVVKASETPGLGSRIREVRYGEKEPYFTKQFKGETVSDFSSGKFKLDAISGATISSKAVESAVRKAVDLFKQESFAKQGG